MSIDIIQGDAREVLAGLAPQSVHTVITSPPYFGLRSYGERGVVLRVTVDVCGERP